MPGHAPEPPVRKSVDRQLLFWLSSNPDNLPDLSFCASATKATATPYLLLRLHALSSFSFSLCTLSSPLFISACMHSDPSNNARHRFDRPERRSNLLLPPSFLDHTCLFSKTIANMLHWASLLWRKSTASGFRSCRFLFPCVILALPRQALA